MPGWFRWLFYEISHWFCYVLATVLFSFRFAGARNLPRAGPALVIANHQSFLDPVLVGVAARRHLAYLARKTLFRNRFFGWLIDIQQAIPVDQDGIAKEGMRAVLRELSEGRAVLVFPEGGRSDDGKLQPLAPGIHLLIRRSGAPVIPVGIAGAFQSLPRGRALPWLSPLFLPAGDAAIAVAIGPPIPAEALVGLPREEALARLSHELEKQYSRAENLRRKPV